MKDIVLPIEAIADEFEKSLHEYYHKSKSRINSAITFNLMNTSWIGVFELSLLSLWILELLKKRKKVKIKLPIEKNIREYLFSYGFIEFLEQNEIEVDRIDVNIKTATRELFRAPFYPLTFLDEIIFRGIIDDLKYGNRMELVFRDVKDSEIIKSGAIRDIVLKELGDNIFIHSQANFSNLIMTKYEASPKISKMDWMKVLARRSGYYEKNFFIKLEGNPFLMLVINDKGQGIFKTLLKEYHNDIIINDKRDSPTECDILKYSFLYYSSSRSVEERLGKIKEVISSNALDLPPPTGLFRLKEIVREFQGLIYLRSGSSFLCYDFYKDRLNDKSITNEDLKINLTNFSGTQFKIMFPIETPRKQFLTKMKYNEPISTRRKLDYVNTDLLILNMLPNAMNLANLEDEAHCLQYLFDEIERIKYEHIKEYFCLILEGLKDLQLSSKAQHYLIFEAMNRQKFNFAIIFTNVDSKLLTLKNDFVNNKNLMRYALVFFNESSDPYLLGVSDSEDYIFTKISKEAINVSNEEERFILKNEHLFFIDNKNKKYSFIYSANVLNPLVRLGIKKIVYKIILDENSFIFHKNIKVLIPSKYYCEGFFETYRLLANKNWRNIVVTYLKYILLEERPDFIISTTKHCGEVIEDSLKIIYDAKIDLKPKHLIFKTPIQGMGYASLILEIDKGKIGVIVTDVIGTGKTISSIIENAPHIEVTKVITFVNAREEDERDSIDYLGKIIPIDTIVKQKLRYYNDLPPGWLYSEILEVDPTTNVLIHNPVELSGPIWKKINTTEETVEEKDGEKQVERKINSFLEEIIFLTGAIEVGHFGSKNKHITYLFNIPKIVKHFSDEMTEIIVKDAKYEISKIQPLQKNVTHILYPDFNPGLTELVNKVSSKFPKSTPLAISYNEFITNYDQEEPKPFIDFALIIDDAFVSGESIFRMLDIAERKGAQNLYVYLIIKRGSDYNARKFEKITQFGHALVRIRYLSDVQIPVFDSSNCPVCQLNNELLELKEYIKNYPSMNFLSLYIDKLIQQNFQKNIEAVIDESILITEKTSIEENNIKLNLRWKLELAKTYASVRNELATMTADYKKLSKNVLILFAIIIQEKSYFLLDKKVKEAIFYDTFVENILLACKYFLKEYGIRYVSELKAVIGIINVFDQDIFIDNLNVLLYNKRLTPELFNEICVQLLLSRKARDYSARIISILSSRSEKIEKEELHKELFEGINGLLRYWETYNKQLSGSRKNNLEIFKELDGAKLHNINHILVSFNLLDGNLLLSWDYLSTNLKDILRMLKSFIGINNNRNDLVKKIEERINRIEIQLEKGQNLIQNIYNVNGKSYRLKQNDLFFSEMESIVERLKDLIWDADGIKNLLMCYRTNMKLVIYRTLQVYDNQLRAKEINVERKLTEELCIVFGDEYNLLRICQNIIENVYLHSGANYLEIILTIEPSKEYVNIEFIDNGIGIPDQFEFKEGLKIVNEIAILYNGNFTINSVKKDYGNELSKLKFSTTAKLSLPFIRQTTNEVNING